MFTPAKILAFSAGFAAAAPFTFPLANGFPTLKPNDPATQQIQVIAGGTLSNKGAPTGLNPETVNSFGLIALNEIFEVAYFSDLVANITNNVHGYELPPGVREYTLNALTAVVAQEELHALTANAIRAANGASVIQPCKFQFPVSDFNSAIALAQTFTDLVQGVLQDVEFNAVSANGASAAGVVQALSSVIGQEAQQDGYYRAIQSKRPSAEPFLTGAARNFAFTALQSFTVPGSCPNIGDIKFNTLQPLTLTTKGAITCSQNVQFEAKNGNGAVVDPANQKLAYFNGANKPLIVDFVVKGTYGDTVNIEAFFPHDENVMDGLTVASIVKKDGDLTTNDGVSAAALFAPGLIEVN